MADDQGEKTEEATPHKREEFRRKGQVAQTKELSSVLTLLGSALVLWALGRFFLEQFFELFRESVGGFLVTAARSGDYAPAVIFVFKKAALIMAPFMGILAVFAYASSALQVGFLVSEEAMKPKLDKLNPISGLQRIFSIKSVVEGAKSVAKVTFIGFITYLVLESEIAVVPIVSQYSLPQLMAYIGSLSLRLLGIVAMVMAGLAALDYMFQRWDIEQKMKMSKQEIKEEHKTKEGDPLIKARIRRVQREMANKRMMADVPTADVIVTNPTHIAVALKYDATMAAPQIVAMGADLVAEKIKEVARENNIPVLENKPLARTMYKTLKIGQAIPRELFTAVAEVLSYVYKLKRKIR